MMSYKSQIDHRTIVVQVRDGLRNLITDDQLEAGDQIPSEAEIATRFGVGRGTVREALKLLEQVGLVEVQHGRGRFVSALAELMVDRPVTEFESVTEMLKGLGYELRNRVVSVEAVDANEKEAAALGLPVGSRVVRLRRLRMHRDEALVYGVNVFSEDLMDGRRVEDADFTGSLNLWLESLGRGPVSSAASLQAVNLPPEVASLQGVDGNQPWIMVTERCVDRQGVPVLFSEDYHRGDIFSFHVIRQRSN